MHKDTFVMLQRLTSLGISTDDAYALRRAQQINARQDKIWDTAKRLNPEKFGSIDKTPMGDQYVLAGAEKATDATIAQRRADMPLRAMAIQRPPDGLFSDDARQIDLIDAIQQRKGE